ncbi:hypothetical protein [Streptomyces cyaneofuscatus]|uniref:hypothetical protein n=1 Tax=Streptomyces cyaneofuscatus TaxID=66883 RepID=UPI00364F900E
MATLKTAAMWFAQGLDRHGGGHAQSTLSAFLADDVVPWLNRPADADVRKRLHTEAARLVFVRARLYSDSGFHGAAQHYYAAALRLAQEADDICTWAMILRGMSSQSLSLNHQRSALAYCENAHAALPSTCSTAIRSFIAAQLAVVRAASGERRPALQALDDASEFSTEHHPSEDPFDTYSVAALAFQRAQALRLLGDTKAAIDALFVSSQHRNPDDRRGLALTHAARTKLLLRAGHVEEACSSWQAFRISAAGLQSTEASKARAELRREFVPYRANSTVAALFAGRRKP